MQQLSCKRAYIFVCFTSIAVMILTGVFITFNGTKETYNRQSKLNIKASMNYDRRYVGILDDSTLEIPSDESLSFMTNEQLEDLYWNYLNTIQVLCKKVVRVGNLHDGGKEVCVDEPFHPRPPCLVYSFGINYQWDFDEDAAGIFGCEVYSFDPSMRDKGDTYKYANNIIFHMIGLGAKSEILQNGWAMVTLEQIQNNLNHSKRNISILKLDIESYEWITLPEMVRSGSLRSVSQMQIELHGKGSRNNLNVLRMLYEDGFRLFMRDRNLSCNYSRKGLVRQRTSCMEISLIKDIRSVK